MNYEIIILYIYQVFNNFQTFHFLMHLAKLLLYSIDNPTNLLFNRGYYIIRYYLIRI